MQDFKDPNLQHIIKDDLKIIHSINSFSARTEILKLTSEIIMN